MQTNPAVEQNKTLNGPLVREISPVGSDDCMCHLTAQGHSRLSTFVQIKTPSIAYDLY